MYFRKHVSCGFLLAGSILVGTHKLQHVPVEDIVIGEALSVEKIPEELPKI